MSEDISFKEFITQVYRKSELTPNSGEGTFVIESEEEISLLHSLYERSIVNYDSNLQLEVGQRIELVFLNPKATFGRLFKSYKDFIKGDMAQINQPNLSQSPYYIKEKDIASFDEKKPPILVNYQLIKNLLLQLIEMDSYTDDVSKKLIFFSKKTFELSIDIDTYIDDFIKIVEELDKDSQEIIRLFCNWIDDEKTSKHIGEIKSIFAFVLSETLPPNANIIDVVKNIRYIHKSICSQYALYLENFSYDKFVKKLAENTEKFISKINETISKVFPQLIGLPFLTAIPTILGSGDNLVVYLTLIVYCIMCILALKNQKTILDYIKCDVAKFEEKGKVPEELKDNWDEDKERIEQLIKEQVRLYRFLYVTTCFCLLYGVYGVAKLVQIIRLCQYIYF